MKQQREQESYRHQRGPTQNVDWLPGGSRVIDPHQPSVAGDPREVIGEAAILFDAQLEWQICHCFAQTLLSPPATRTATSTVLVAGAAANR